MGGYGNIINGCGNIACACHKNTITTLNVTHFRAKSYNNSPIKNVRAIVSRVTQVKK